MKKKLLVIALMLAMVFAFTACGGGDGSSDSQDNDQAGTEMMGESVDLISCDQGEVKFIGFMKADPELVDVENAYVFVFEYTNRTDEPSQCQSTFWIQYFQNGAELSDNPSYSSKAEEQYELVSAFYNEALKDGTIRFGQIVVAKDDSPITVMAKEQYSVNHSDHYETIEVNLIDGTVTGGNSTDEVDASVDVEALLQGDWVLQEVNVFSFENGAATVSQNGTEILSGEYAVNYDTSEIDCVYHASDGDTKIHLPFKVQDGELHIYNNQGEELIHQ